MSDENLGANESDESLKLRIRAGACAIREQESRPEGRDLDHWLQAKSEMAPSHAPLAEVRRLETALSTPGERDRPAASTGTRNPI